MDSTAALLQKAQQFLRSAAVLLELHDFDSCASRSYLAMFFSAQALLQQEGFSLSTRQGVRSAFIRSYVEPGVLPQRAGIALEQGAALQELADYAPGSVVTLDQAEWILQEAEAFVNSIAGLTARVQAQ